MFTWALEVEAQLVRLNRTKINEISSNMADLAGALGTALRSTDTDLADQARIVSSTYFLKRTGVVDPNVDMFVAIFDNDVEALKAALEAGADQSITDTQVLAAHEAELADFDPNEWS
jgi:hypothetical protein